MARGASEILGGKKAGKAKYPPDHEPGMAVPKGGSSCATCEYYKGRMRCGSKFFIAWNGSDKIPATSPDEYCSDWYEQIKEDDLPSYEDGGIVKETGPAIVHKGERVIPVKPKKAPAKPKKTPKTDMELGPDITPPEKRNLLQQDDRDKARLQKVV